ncbi:mitochondrial carrier domain-containing protein [Jimgerdemannia flammicorona]|uniref:Mitochondrial carrier domain-containing protein n=1 Tax=Jimgerdemannia flammicorona TaxID=994334 RepID=A0A433DI78_9FUNG|nr:mitochondrial carrier domain-containing protein [Jimgerdemannia flammicorona]
MSTVPTELPAVPSPIAVAGGSGASVQPGMLRTSKKKKAHEYTAIGAPTAIARTLIMQGMHFWYRTPLKLFRPLRVDYMVMARAIMPIDNATKRRFSFRYTYLGMLANAVKLQGWRFIPRHVLPPLLANTFIGTVLYTTYIATLPVFHPASSFQKHRTFPPPPFSSVFMAGMFAWDWRRFSFRHYCSLLEEPTFLLLLYIFTMYTTCIVIFLPLHLPLRLGALAGAAQAVVATPMDSLKVRFEVMDLLEGKHRSMWAYARDTLRKLGVGSAYRGFTLTLVRDSFACGLFFGTFEWVKQQGYYYFLDEVYGVRLNAQSVTEKSETYAVEEGANQRARPHFMIEPLFILFAGAAAAVRRQLLRALIAYRPGTKHRGPDNRSPTSTTFPPHYQAYQLIEHPLSRIHSIFWIEEAQSEFAHPSSRETTRALYRQTWAQVRLQVQRAGGSWLHFLYHEFTSTIVRSVPATSVGFLVFEMVKREIDRRGQGGGDEDVMEDMMEEMRRAVGWSKEEDVEEEGENEEESSG